ncbi:MAG: adenylate/guanylate cyclase domain-containing protein [Pseudomonadota bacterium]
MSPAAQDISDWLLKEGLAGLEFGPLLTGLCERLVDAGVPLVRCNFSMRAYHPEFGAFAYRWKRATGMEHEQYVRDSSIQLGWDQSPLKYLVETDHDEIRFRFSPDDTPYRFPMFEDLVAQGASDYFALRLRFDGTGSNLSDPTQGVGLLASFAGTAPDGFSDTDLDTLRKVAPAMALALKANANMTMAQDLMATYLGADAGARVLSGAVGRGSVEGTEAVILYFDLAGFTKMSEALGPGIVEMLNAYFGAVVPAIEARGGNVLKFMGDGILAIFGKDSVPDTEMAAVDCLLDLQGAMAEVSSARAAENLPTTTATMALHAGEVFYGNIGSATRLDFTVIGPAVNTAARIEAMTGAVDQPVVIGAKVARPLLERRNDLVSLGQYRLRGVADRQELFTLD